MANRMEQVIADLEEYIDNCKNQAFSSTKIIVDRPQIEEFLDELRQYMPEEVKKYQRMLVNRDKILSDAKKKAAETEDKAKAYAEHLATESNITKMAYDKAQQILTMAKNQANDILQNATEEANQIREGAFAYTNDMLEALHGIVSGTLDDVNEKYSALSTSLKEHQTVIEKNAKELSQSEYLQEAPSVNFDETQFALPKDFTDEGSDF